MVKSDNTAKVLQLFMAWVASDTYQPQRGEPTWKAFVCFALEEIERQATTPVEPSKEMKTPPEGCPKHVLALRTPAEIQSGHDRLRWAEDLILQLPPDHDGRNSWLLNFGAKYEARRLRALRGYALDLSPDTRSVVPKA